MLHIYVCYILCLCVLIDAGLLKGSERESELERETKESRCDRVRTKKKRERETVCLCKRKSGREGERE